ncbi:glycosyltransferase [Pseudoduganella sp. GCM10020061]|uniref:glycosyltransferase n=1 Tax=Pseudoduganella sp. GCM10020061 TaxID=3317345 RepID=UPI00363F14EC
MSSINVNFSVLMVFSDTDEFRDLVRCFESFLGQTAQPDSVILVLNGIKARSFRESIQLTFPSLTFVMVEREAMVGFSEALDAGLDYCDSDYVARMDPDDWLHGQRFKVQTDFIQAHPHMDIVGGHINEWDSGGIVSVRKAPLSIDDIRKFSRYRCPFNHVTVFIRTALLRSLGGYNSFSGVEDYYLWVRALNAGAVCANLDTPLVNVSAGSGMLSRRRGMSYLKKEFRLQFFMFRSGHIRLPALIFNLASRSFLRLSPRPVLGWAYKFLRSNYEATSL